MHEKKAEKVKAEAAVGKNLFYIFGFVPESETGRLQKLLNDNFKENLIVILEDIEKRTAGQSPPTKIKNSRIFRPFEFLVMMYGIPNYNEKDPTVFFAFTYMLLFGAMFGDVGQGLVIVAAGLLVSRKRPDSGFGGILARLGASSVVFGFLYGSIFGMEEIIPELLIRPMANINYVLYGAVIIGVLLLTASYLYGLSNLFKAREYEEFFFGRDGLAGFALFWLIILAAARWSTKTDIFSNTVLLGILGALIALMIVKHPLMNLISGRGKLYDGSVADYYIEAGFGVIEMLLSVMSNTISFIRVGAFALNHVGLYIAFSTMAKMMSSEFGGVVVLILGNIVIIGLEGLVVFIQGLRLEYYELFSKYYSGYGILYKPVSLTEKEA